ncbi:MAG TPA: hypothetical protein VK783_00215 [Bacteroidia bacterium]|jgi:hypothetical protein|nr:hypothetical protein [Bacteroidia bacterium]
MIDTTIIPLYIRIITGVFALANIGYGIVGYFKPSQIFENSTEGVDVKGKGARYAGYEYASRNLSIGIGLLIVAIMGSPLSIVMVMGVRALVEVQSMLINLSLKKINEGFITAAVFFAIELFVIAKCLY